MLMVNSLLSGTDEAGRDAITPSHAASQLSFSCTVGQMGSGNRWIKGTKRSDRRCCHNSPRLAYVSGYQEAVVKWTGMYLVGFIILLGGVVAALWKLGILASIGTTWTLIGVTIAVGIGIMIAVSNSGAKENIEIQRK